MNPINKKTPGAKVIPQSLIQQRSPQAGAFGQCVKRPIAPSPLRPQTKPAVAQPKTANATVNRKLPGAPPIYQPQPAPKVLQPKTSSARSQSGSQALGQQVAPSLYRQTIQRAEQPPEPPKFSQIPGLPGHYDGPVPPGKRKGDYNTVYSQTEPTQPGCSVMSHSSAKMSKRARQHLVDFAKVEHVVNEENNHAEDKLAVYAHQLAIVMSFKNEGKKLPDLIHIPEFFVSASPCSSKYKTSSKQLGCTENLITWATKGLRIESDDGCKFHFVKVKIVKLVVDHLYKSNSIEGARNSMAAIKWLKESGAIGGWLIQNQNQIVNNLPNFSKTG